MEFLPPAVLKEEFHSNRKTIVDWTNDNGQQTISQIIKDENILFDSYSCNKCFELCSLLLNHQIEHHDSVDSERRLSFLDVLKEIESKINYRTDESAYTDPEYDYEIVATLIKIPKIKQEFNIVVEPTIHQQLTNVNASCSVSSNDESAHDFDGNDDDRKSMMSSDDNEYRGAKRKLTKNRSNRSGKSNIGRKKVECDICGKFYSHKGIVNHRKRAHPPPKMGVRHSVPAEKVVRRLITENIEVIDQIDVKTEDIKVGAKKRAVEKSYICDLCNDTSSSKLKILKHFKSVHRSLFSNEPTTRRRKYDKQCPCCSKVINGLVAYRCHMKQYHPETISSDQQQAKEKRAVDNSLKILCDICGKGFSSDRLKVHKQSHSEARPHKCTICDRDYRQKKQLQDHMNTHTGDRPYKCVYDGCDKTFAHNSARHAHLKLMHGTVKNHKCEFCSKLFAIRYAYIIHRRVHTNERPHGCDVCGNKFKTRRHLLRHMQIHTQEKPHKCHLCNKGFADAMGLKQHHRAKRPCVVPSAIVCTAESNSAQPPAPTVQPPPPPPPAQIYPPDENLYKL